MITGKGETSLHYREALMPGKAESQEPKDHK